MVLSQGPAALGPCRLEGMLEHICLVLYMRTPWEMFTPSSVQSPQTAAQAATDRPVEGEVTRPNLAQRCSKLGNSRQKPGFPEGRPERPL